MQLKLYKPLVMAALVLASVVFSHAQATTITYTYLQNQSPGSSLTYNGTGDISGYQADVTIWADLGSGTLEESATGHEVTGSGLGVCNSLEGDLATCLGKKNRPTLDNGGEYEWILVHFSEVLRIDSFTVVPDRNQDRDITFFTGWLTDATEVADASYTDLVTARSPGGSGLGMTRYEFNTGKSTDPAVVDVAGIAGGEVWGNSILIGASLTSGADRVYLNNTVTRVPVPAALWLFVSGLGMLVARRKLQS